MDKQGVYDIAEKTKMEGIVLKNINGTYTEGKSKDAVKVKFKETDTNTFWPLLSLRQDSLPSPSYLLRELTLH